MKSFHKALLGLAMLGAAATVQAQNEQFIPILSYRVGPYAAGGSGYFGGTIDYFNLVNANGGINGASRAWLLGNVVAALVAIVVTAVSRRQASARPTGAPHLDPVVA
mgnify:CR=1 FL=1